MISKMLSLQQCRHVITYYCLQLMNTDSSTPAHISRDVVFMNKQRGEVCSEVYSNPRLQPVVSKIHDAVTIHQVNSIPMDSICAIDKKKIPLCTGGIQLIIYDRKKRLVNICIQKKYQQICYFYFRLRHFPNYIENEIKKWLNRQPWYLPRSQSVNIILKQLLKSNFSERIHAELNETIDLINKC